MYIFIFLYKLRCLLNNLSTHIKLTKNIFYFHPFKITFV